MIGIALDLILMLLLVCAIAYGVRLEKKLVALRAGQLAFAGAVTELNIAAGRAENALASLRASGEEADLLHDRILKARAVKQELDVLIARAPSRSVVAAEPAREDRSGDQGDEPLRARAPSNISARAAAPSLPVAKDRKPFVAQALPDDEDRALRMAALAERISGMATPRAAANPPRQPISQPGRDNVAAILGALTANQAAQQSLNKARRSLDDDLFAA